jgi:hypothetical protein
MWTKKQVLVTRGADGTIQILQMRYNVSHQRGWRCFLSPLAEAPTAIGEETVPSFQGRSLFDALAVFRSTIEPAGGRLLHAMASRECWPDTKTFDRFCRRLTLGSRETELIDGFLPIDVDEAATLDEQRDCYEAWQASVPPDIQPASVPLSRARKALDETNAAIRANREASILSRGDLASGPEDDHSSD